MREEFKLFVGKDQQYYFHLQAGNNKIILKGSEGYTTKNAALNGIESVRENSQIDDNFQRFTNEGDEPQFRLVASNGKTIGVGESYSSVQKMEQGIESVKKFAPIAPINDEASPSQNIVTIYIKEVEYKVQRGSRKVTELKEIGSVPNGHDLVQIEGTKLTLLKDDQRVVIKGGEKFDCTPKTGADS